MSQKELTELTNEELLAQWKKARSGNIAIAVLIGLLLGAFAYGAVKKGFTFFTFFPLFMAAFLVNVYKKNKAIGKEVKSRNLE